MKRTRGGGKKTDPTTPPVRRRKAGQEEKALVLKALHRRDESAADPFAEIVALARTAGVRVVQTVPQRLEHPNAATYLGQGKLEEAAAAADQLDVDTFIADNDLSPAQERNLEEISRRKVVDRSQLIMDIFARRARTRQAKLQVELAQLRYSLPRLKRMWGHLSRFEGGIGMRGPGETQLETDKRLIRKRIQRLARELEEIERRNEAALQNRERDFVISVVGYTNAGKSTLLNRLTGADSLVEDKLFATLESRTRAWKVAPRRQVLISDTVGFIQNLPHHLVASFQATLAEVRHADLLFHVVDASSPEAEGQIRTVEKVLGELECEGKPTWILLNKWDALGTGGEIEARHLRTHFPAGTRVFEISAESGMGLEALARAVEQALDEKNVPISLRLPHDRGDLVSYLQANAKISKLEYSDEGIEIEAEISPARAAKFKGMQSK